MSSDLYDVEIINVKGNTIDIHVTAGLATGGQDFSVSRSFALLVLDDALEEEGIEDDGKHPLLAALNALDWEHNHGQEPFYAAHLDKFITRAVLTYRTAIAEGRAWGDAREEIRERTGLEEYGDSPMDRMVPRHAFGMTVTVTDEKYLQGLRRGIRFGTTAFDVWVEDPQIGQNLTSSRKPVKKLKMEMHFLALPRAGEEKRAKAPRKKRA